MIKETNDKGRSNSRTTELAPAGVTRIDKPSSHDFVRDAGAQETLESSREFSQEDGGAPSASKLTASSSDSNGSVAPLFSAAEIGTLRERWESIQAGFIDEPKHSVTQADQLVSEAINRLAEGFGAERKSLEQQWYRGDSVTTEDLRLSLCRYRSFFERLLSV